MTTKKDSIKSVSRHKHTDDPLNDPAMLIDYVSDAIISTDMDNHIHSWNHRAEKLFGWSAEEAIGKQGAELLRTEFPKGLTSELLLEEMHKHGKWHGELIQSTKDNRELTVESTAIELKDVSGKPLGVVSIVHDITDRRKAEEMLRQSEETFRVTQELSPDGFLIYRPLRDSTDIVIDFLWIYENDAAAQMNGTSPNEVRGRRVSEVLPGHDKSPFAQAYKEVAETCEVRIIEEADYFLDTVQQRRWFRVIAIPTPGGDVAILVQDITKRKIAEEKLKHKEYRLLEAQRIARLGNWEWNLQTGKVFWSREIYKMQGISEDITTLTPEILEKQTHPDDLMNVKTAMSRALSEGAPVDIIYRVVFSDGSIRVIHALGNVAEFDKDGKPLIMVGTNQDITDREKAEELLRTSKANFQSIFNASPIGIILGDSEGRVIQSNSSIELMLGYSKEELHGMSFMEFTDSSHLSTEMPLIAELAAGKRKSYEIEKQYIRKDGQVIWVKMIGTTIIGSNGELVGLAMIEDITKRKKSEAMIHQLLQSTQIEKDRLLILINNIPDEVWCFDANGEVELVNATVLKSFGSLINLKAATKVNDSSVVYQANGKPRRAEDSPPLRALKGEVVIEQEEIVRVPASNEFRTRQVNASPIKDHEDNIVGAIAIVRDITDRKRLENELKKYSETLEDTIHKRTEELQKLNEALIKSNKELENFAYVASHDLQEPLRMVTSFTQLLEQRYGSQLDQNARDYIGFAVDGAKRMHELINGLLSYSRISRNTTQFTDVDLNMVLREVIANLDLTIKERNCQVEYGDLPIVIANKSQMQQLIQNLIANGIKYCDNNPNITISVLQENSAYVFSVKDNGIGIEPQYFDKIFEIFKRLHQSEKYPGTGLGLAICKRIVENHNGKIWVESGPGAGSTFHFTLPKIV